MQAALNARLEGLITRAGFAGFALVCWSTASLLWESANVNQQGLSLVLALALYVVAGGLLIAAAWRRANFSATWLLVPLLLIFAGYWQTHTVNSQQSGGLSNTDVWMYTDYAATAFRLGDNPYSQNLLDAFRVNRAPFVLSTPLINGDVSVQYAYPALSFLLFVPFQSLGLSTTLVYPLCLLLTLLVVFWGTPHRWRPVILLPLFLDVRYMLYAMGGVSDIMWTLATVMVILHWRRHGWRAIWFGLACAIKQQPWFLAPFLVIRIWHEEANRPLIQRLSAIVKFGLVSAWIFLLINLPFMIWDLNAWLTGIMEPLQTSMIVLGQGVSSLMLLGLVVIPKAFFTIVLFGGLALALLLYWRHYDSFPEVMWLVPGLVFWFSHRSLPSYWYYFAILFIFAVVRLSDGPPPKPLNRDWRLSAGIATAAAAFVIGSVVFFASQPAKLAIAVNGPLETVGGWVMRTQVQVTNYADQPVVPRFAIQSGSRQPMFWQIDQGPTELAAHASADFTISTDMVGAAFESSRGALIIVSDAAQYDLRASTTILADTASRYYDGLANGSFRFWDIASGLPAAWGVLASTPGVDAPSLIRQGNRANSIELTLPGSAPTSGWNYLKLDTWLPVPQSPLLVWVKPPASANQWPAFETVYGFELYLADSDTYIWVMFGNEQRSGQLEDNLYYWMLPAPVETWSLQAIDAEQIISALGLELSFQETSRFDMTLPAKMINLRLLLAARSDRPSPVTAEFGEIRLQDLPLANEQLIQQVLDQPELVYVWHGDRNYTMRNYTEAVASYTHALEINTDSGAAHLGLGQSLLALQDFPAAISAFEMALATSEAIQPKALVGIGWAQLHLDNLEASRQAFDQALYYLANEPRHDPTMIADAYAGIGTLMVRQQECEIAQAYFQYARNLDPRTVDFTRQIQPCTSTPAQVQIGMVNTAQ